MAAILGLMVGVCLTLVVTLHRDRMTGEAGKAGEAGSCPPQQTARTRDERDWITRRNAIAPVQIRTRASYDYRFPNKLEQGGFTRVGTLTGQVDGQTQVLPLYSRPSGYSGRANYHSQVAGFDGQPIAVHYRGRDCLNTDMGCEEIYDGTDEGVELPSLTTGTFKPYLFA